MQWSCHLASEVSSLLCRRAQRSTAAMRRLCRCWRPCHGLMTMTQGATGCPPWGLVGTLLETLLPRGCAGQACSASGSGQIHQTQSENGREPVRQSSAAPHPRKKLNNSVFRTDPVLVVPLCLIHHSPAVEPKAEAEEASTMNEPK